MNVKRLQAPVENSYNFLRSCLSNIQHRTQIIALASVALLIASIIAIGLRCRISPLKETVNPIPEELLHQRITKLVERMDRVKVSHFKESMFKEGKSTLRKLILAIQQRNFFGKPQTAIDGFVATLIEKQMSSEGLITWCQEIINELESEQKLELQLFIRQMHRIAQDPTSFTQGSKSAADRISRPLGDTLGKLDKKSVEISMAIGDITSGSGRVREVKHINIFTEYLIENYKTLFKSSKNAQK